jgi:exopolysaccharide biosynthesis polyprenyl glycosylphosphotransferase
MGLQSSPQPWRGVAFHFFLDVALFLLSFYLSVLVRFEDWALLQAYAYAPSVISGAFAFASLGYISGLYAPLQPVSRNGLHWALRLAIALAISFVVISLVQSVNFSARIGRGVLLGGLSGTLGLGMIHHTFLWRRLRRMGRQTVACLVINERDLVAAELFRKLTVSAAPHVGLIMKESDLPETDLEVFGFFDNIATVSANRGIHAILCAEDHLTQADIAPTLRQLRYQGVEILSLVTVCESIHGAVPQALVTDSWLVSASAQPRHFYVRKVKRAFDIALAVVFTLTLWPLLLLGMLAIKLSSPGPVIYSQIRSGRFGRPFRIFKLRSMHLNAEAAGAQWSSQNDPRTFTVGKWLRQFRIDEIPQLWNVLLGDMSFVGPRPERPEFIKTLSQRIAFFDERTLVQPGLTGWAQVRYPYGASVEDARRKLEYDLYYIKHLGILLDLFILMDTIRIVLTGGVRRGSWEGMAEFTAQMNELIPESLGSNSNPSGA